MSGDYAAKLWRRARALLEGALWRLERGEYDLACFEAEQAAQLALKALLYEATGSAPRTHDLSTLLGTLYRFLRDSGLEQEARQVASHAQEHRPLIWLLEDAYTKARYGDIEYTERDAQDCVEEARRLLGLAERLRQALHREVHG